MHAGLDVILHRPLVVLGLGATGKSVLKWLKHRGAERVYVMDDSWTDSKRQVLHDIGIGEVLEGEDGIAALQAHGIESVIVSPGVMPDHPVRAWARTHAKSIVNDIQLWAWALSDAATLPKIIGITGSNGKSTVTAWIADVLPRISVYQAVAVGNIGLPVLDVLRELECGEREAVDVWVVELSSFQLDDCEPLPWTVSAILNISEDHLDYHGDMSGYVDAKSRIISHAKAVLLPDATLLSDRWRSDFAKTLADRPSPCLVEWFGIEGASSWRLESPYLAHDASSLHYDTRDLYLLGEHNALNALVVMAVVQHLGINVALPAFWSAMCLFEGLPHRTRRIAQWEGIDFIDDSKGTNVGSTVAALEGLGVRYKSIFLIAGGDGKGQDFQPLLLPIQRFCAEVALIGRDASQLAHLFDQNASIKAISYRLFASLEAAVDHLSAQAQSGDAVVLSPACASWDMFRHYAHRAEVFQQAVEAYIRQANTSC